MDQLVPQAVPEQLVPQDRLVPLVELAQPVPPGIPELQGLLVPRVEQA